MERILKDAIKINVKENCYLHLDKNSNRLLVKDIDTDKVINSCENPSNSKKEFKFLYNNDKQMVYYDTQVEGKVYVVINDKVINTNKTYYNFSKPSIKCINDYLGIRTDRDLSVFKGGEKIYEEEHLIGKHVDGQICCFDIYKDNLYKLENKYKKIKFEGAEIEDGRGLIEYTEITKYNLKTKEKYIKRIELNARLVENFRVLDDDTFAIMTYTDIYIMKNDRLNHILENSLHNGILNYSKNKIAIKVKGANEIIEYDLENKKYNLYKTYYDLGGYDKNNDLNLIAYTGGNSHNLVKAIESNRYYAKGEGIKGDKLGVFKKIPNSNDYLEIYDKDLNYDSVIEIKGNESINAIYNNKLFYSDSEGVYYRDLNTKSIHKVAEKSAPKIFKHEDDVIFIDKNISKLIDNKLIEIERSDSLKDIDISKILNQTRKGNICKTNKGVCLFLNETDRNVKMIEISISDNISISNKVNFSKSDLNKIKRVQLIEGKRKYGLLIENDRYDFYEYNIRNKTIEYKQDITEELLSLCGNKTIDIIGNINEEALLKTYRNGDKKIKEEFYSLNMKTSEISKLEYKNPYIINNQMVDLGFGVILDKVESTKRIRKDTLIEI